MGVLRREWIEPDLRVIGLGSPRVLVFRAVADEKQNTMARKALDEGVEHRLRFGVRPVQILEHGDHGLAPTVLEKQ